jgi:hypothetical protein
MASSWQTSAFKPGSIKLVPTAMRDGQKSELLSSLLMAQDFFDLFLP